MLCRGPRSRREKAGENLLEEIMAENFPNLGKERNIQVQGAKGVPKKINPKSSTRRYIVIKISNLKRDS